MRLSLIPTEPVTDIAFVAREHIVSISLCALTFGYTVVLAFGRPILKNKKSIQHLGIKFSCIFTVCCQIWLPWLLGWFSSVQ